MFSIPFFRSPFFRFNYPYFYTKPTLFASQKNEIPPEEPILEIMGIRLFQDDLIILALLFFLYKEGVKDELLFISLVMLLLS